MAFIELNSESEDCETEHQVIDSNRLAHRSVSLLKITGGHRRHGRPGVLLEDTGHDVLVGLVEFDEAANALVDELVAPGRGLAVVEVEGRVGGLVFVVFDLELDDLALRVFELGSEAEDVENGVADDFDNLLVD